MSLAPVVLFVYNRPIHTKATLDSLLADPLAAQSELYVFSDGPKHPEGAPLVQEVRDLVKSVKGFKAIHVMASEGNQGLSNAVISGVTQVLAAHGRAIVFEDDLRVVPGILGFFNAALYRYDQDRKIFAVSGWAPLLEYPRTFKDEVYLSARALCWGWATWHDRWSKIDWDVKDFVAFDRDKGAKRDFSLGGADLPDMLRNSLTGKVNSWAVRWAYAQFRQRSYTLVPKRSYVDNLGHDDSGTNSKAKFQFRPAQLMTAGAPIPPLPGHLIPHAGVLERFRKYYGYNWKAKLRKFFGRL